MKERAERTTSPDAKDLLGRWALDLGGRVAPEIEHGAAVLICVPNRLLFSMPAFASRAHRHHSRMG